ncbi:UDP-N-acetylmuramate--L-alanine ligase [Olivibacter sp. XZL3]|uniref:UDP-N-acetylmuramate--L-alanine ligase n=1 Tax=Olivibacter sp. XZL3 TaxID=1735116 RepID=UPI0010662591|nr:Mur ligase family protein [Olivibacter sp. XZL3]
MRVHFIAIGGSVMHNLAIALADKGYLVSGSDDFIYEPSRTNLANKGLLPEQLGWHPDRITEDINAVVLGMHAKADNPELLKAQELGLQIYSYPAYIYEQSKEKTRVVIGGSHGKTTITSMIMHVLKVLERDFDYVVGAKLEGFDTMVRITKNAPLIVIEGDEYLASAIDRRPKFLLYHANIALISGIAWDHINVFPTYEEYVEQFRHFIESIEEKGTLVYNKDDKEVQALVSENNSNINKHGYKMPAFTINKGVSYLKTGKGEVALQIFGKHNLSNLAGAFTVCEWLGVSRDDFYKAIGSFRGAARRLEYVADYGGSVVYKDFAHSPSKVRASIDAVKEQYPTSKLIAIVELHTFSSLNEEFLREYRDTMRQADEAVVFIDQNSFRQKNIKPIETLTIKKAFNREDIIYLNDVQSLETYVGQLSPKGKNLLFMSSGNFGGINLVNLSDKFFNS